MAAKKYDSSRRAGETPEQHYRRLAKAANQRLVRLEKLSYEKGYKNVLKWSYQYAQREINYYQGKKSKIPLTSRQLTYMKKAGKTPGRFSEKLPVINSQMEMNKLEGKIARIQEFLDRPTSTPGTIKDIYKKRVQTLNKNWNMDFKWEDLADFFESDAYKEFSNQHGGSYDSATILTFKRTVDAMDDATEEAIQDTINKYENASEAELVKALKENSEIHLNVYDENGNEDEVAMNFIYKELAKNGLSLLDLKK
ncbi:MAG: hypothetical protein J6S67_07960 [Methanobrevibacter sp.]|nr:hypothetical protein [Methanobrevibacter sp.]